MNKKIPVIIALFLIALTITSLYFKNDITAVLENFQYKNSLSAERQELYDKMQIEYVNIKNRITGTAPFNEGTTSNENGIDVSETDNYVRTLDVIKYTVELGIAPNTKVDGVTDASTFKGGVIKVKAKLPNQTDLILMTWEQDAWMQNVTYSSDKTEIYAEYHVPSGVSVTNANQNLTFTIKVNGYKKEITSDMKPEFEIWMEGNQPDNATSEAPSISVKDNKDLIISGKEIFNIMLQEGSFLNHQGKRTINGKEVRGNYINFGIGLALNQDVSVLSDLRGIAYPGNTFKTTLKLTYYYYDLSTSNGYQELTEDNDISYDIINGTEVITYNLNMKKNPELYPTSSEGTNIRFLPYGYLYSDPRKSVQDSGLMNLTLNDNIMEISFTDYILNGIFPTNHVNGDPKNGPNFSPKEGIFAVGNIELFVPYYDDDAGKNYDYQLKIEATDVEYKDIEGQTKKINKNTQGVVADNNTQDNTVIKSIQTRLSGSIIFNTYAKDKKRNLLSSYYNNSDGGVIAGEEVVMYTYSRAISGPFLGGSDNLLIWDPNLATIIPYSDTQQILTSEDSTLGFPTYGIDDIEVKYGIYKNTKGLISDIKTINSALYEDFTWYDSIEAAEAVGQISALYINDPTNQGYGINRHHHVRYQTNPNAEILDTFIVRCKIRYFEDEERTKARYYNGESSYYSETRYVPTKYNEDGSLNSLEGAHEHGETVLLLGYKTSIITTVTDKTSSGTAKKNYDVGDGEINIQLNPTISDGTSTSGTSKTIDSVLITATLPTGLSYKNDSANKEPKSVTINMDGTTTIVWEYKNWIVNNPAPDYSSITFTSEISASLENNVSLEISSVIFAPEDTRNEAKFRTSIYGVIISNLAGSKTIKSIDKPLLDTNESFNVTNSIVNTSQENLINVKSIEILPTNGDTNGSKINGEYTIKVISLATNQKMYYTTKEKSVIGLTEDKYGKLTIKNVDLSTDDRWTEVNVGDTIPATATAIATHISTIAPSSNITYSVEINPTNNAQGNVYAFTKNVTSDNLQAAVKSNTVVAKVIERKIEGFAFVDMNRNDIYDDGDAQLLHNVVKLLDSNGNQVATTQTDNRGKYIFENVDKGTYYLEFSIPANFELVSKNGGEASVSSSVNTNNRTDLITGHNSSPTKEVITISNQNLGIRKIDAKLIVHHYIDGTTTKLADDQESTVYYGDIYTTDIHPNIPDNYELKRKTENFTGTVSTKNIEVIYYYQKKDSTLEATITKTGPEVITKKDEPVTYKIIYTAKVTDYIGEGTITIVDTLPHKINLELSNLDEGTYNEEQNTITWTITWTDIDSFNNKGETLIEKNISIVYSDILPTERIMVNSVKSSIVLENNSRDTEAQISTNIQIPGTIIVHHYIKDTEVSIGDSVTTTNLVGEQYTSSSLDIEGYIITKPETEEYTYTEEEQVIIYYYEKIKVKVNTHVDGIGGTITGDEDVEYGNDSTKDKIVIKPDEGYVLGEVIINGEKIELTEKDKYGLVLENFHEMKEDMNVVVKFTKVVEEENPDTGAFISIIIISAIPISLAIIAYLKRHKKLLKI